MTEDRPAERSGMKTAAILAAGLMICALQARAGEEPAKEGPSVAHRILLYIPNRVLDVFDMVRARVRLGPGIAVGARVTDYADFYVGSYLSVYAGLPGPRCRRMPRLPVGLETQTGVEVSVADAATGLGLDPGYSKTEIGLGAHVLLIGADIGIDPVEIVDFLGGFFLWDPRKDDF